MGYGQWKGRTLERGPFGGMAEGFDQAESPAAAAAGAGESEEDDPESLDELSPPLLPLDEVDAGSVVDSLLSSFSTGRLGRP